MMIKDTSLGSRHFSVELLADGVYACIHKPGGAAFSNAGIIDLGDRTILVDAFDTMLAGRDLRRVAETLLDRSVDTIALTHPHSDHWIGVSVFEESTAVLASKETRRVCLEWGAEILEGIQDTPEWEAWREGIDDVKYLLMLQELIDRRPGSEPARAAAEWLDDLRRRIPKPQGLDYSAGPTPKRDASESPFILALRKAFSSDDLQKIRHDAAQHIVKLLNAKEK